MPGFYEHEEAAHILDKDDESEDGEVEQLDLVIEQPKERLRPPVSAPARPSTSSMKMEDIPSIRHPKPKLLGRERSKSDVGHRSNRSRADTADDKKAQICPICSRTLMTDNEGLNSHVDFCLSRTAIQDARNEGSSIKSGTPDRRPMPPKPKTAVSTSKGWEFLMAQKDVLPTIPKGSKKRKYE